ncbi:MAG TPA: AbrB/MazE/SpoVT family DNA-binding domain-containing protein [Bosea sp. (in: a-proteobacteria)]
MSSFIAKVTSKGQLTIPAELRREWTLAAGDTVAFTRMHDGTVRVWPRNLPATAICGMLAHLKSDPAYESDDDAIMDQVLEDDERTKTARNRSNAA